MRKYLCFHHFKKTDFLHMCEFYILTFKALQRLKIHNFLALRDKNFIFHYFIKIKIIYIYIF